MHDFIVQNLVGKCEVGFEIDLYKVYDNPEARKYCKYDPEVFPGLVFRLMSPRVVLLVYASGNVVITGAKVS
jgi:transcription initiation factor TFIID TATA-box-binding protein